MNHSIEKSLGLKDDICDVCGIALNLETAVSQEYMGEVLTFCSDQHLKEYLKDPSKFEEREEAEE